MPFSALSHNLTFMNWAVKTAPSSFPGALSVDVFLFLYMIYSVFIKEFRKNCPGVIKDSGLDRCRCLIYRGSYYFPSTSSTDSRQRSTAFFAVSLSSVSISNCSCAK